MQKGKERQFTYKLLLKNIYPNHSLKNSERVDLEIFRICLFPRFTGKLVGKAKIQWILNGWCIHKIFEHSFKVICFLNICHGFALSEIATWSL